MTQTLDSASQAELARLVAEQARINSEYAQANDEITQLDVERNKLLVKLDALDDAKIKLKAEWAKWQASVKWTTDASDGK